MHGTSSAGDFPGGVSQGRVVGERSHRPFGIGGAEVMGVRPLSDAVKHARGASARERDIGRELIPVAWGVWVGRGLSKGDERAVPDGGRAAAQRRAPCGNAKANEYAIGVRFHSEHSILVSIHAAANRHQLLLR